MRWLLASVLFVVPSLSFAYQNCVAEVNDVMLVQSKWEHPVRLVSEAGDGQGVLIGVLEKGEQIRVADVVIRSGSQIWLHIVRENGQMGWVFEGNFGNVAHGHSPLCQVLF